MYSAVGILAFGAGRMSRVPVLGDQAAAVDEENVEPSHVVNVIGFGAAARHVRVVLDMSFGHVLRWCGQSRPGRALAAGQTVPQRRSRQRGQVHSDNKSQNKLCNAEYLTTLRSRR